VSAKFYLVGGAVRDKLLGLKPKDLDYACEAASYDEMRQAIVDMGGEIFLENQEFFTIRAKVPGMGAADFVLCRKDGKYTDGRRPETVEVGTLLDDLARRDFTVNAMAEASDGSLVDPFHGQYDLQQKLLRCVGNAEHRFSEDHLRILRAIRFCVTKGFHLDWNISACLYDKEIMKHLKDVSQDRVVEELRKCFKHNTKLTLDYLVKFSMLTDVFGNNLWLEPTLRKS
jgi:tRNA nucleotidyltransferase (CCA-adding enzyme)